MGVFLLGVLLIMLFVILAFSGSYRDTPSVTRTYSCCADEDNQDDVLSKNDGYDSSSCWCGSGKTFDYDDDPEEYDRDADDYDDDDND